MKKNSVAILGKGKTGSKVIELLEKENISFTIFDSKNLLTLEKLKNHEAVISFLPAEPFENYIPLLIESKIPVISGTTGFVYTDELKKKVFDNNLKWIVANNFSLGMNLVKAMIEILGKAERLVSNPLFQIHEIHHTKKLDAPSGTAKSFKNWLNHEVEITSERTGDVIGFHEITLTTETEKIKLTHEALDRKIFAEGAVFAYKKLINPNNIPFGIHEFQKIIEKELL